MARVAAQALAGFYPAPNEAVDLALSRVALDPGNHVVFDPCAGEGAAVYRLAAGLYASLPPKEASYVAYDDARPTLPALKHVFVCEMEAGRYAKLDQARWQHFGNKVPVTTARGDAFALDLGLDSNSDPVGQCSILWANPPYDQDPEAGPGGRLEERWLKRFTPALAPGGVLLFLVPYYALAASADTIAREYDAVECWRLPGALFDQFKQVLLVARRAAVPLHEPDAAVAHQVRAWADDADATPELGASHPPPVRVRGLEDAATGFDAFSVRALDLALVRAALTPWEFTKRGSRVAGRGVLPEGPFADLITRRYPVATPPRPPHIAAGIAAGAYNGARLHSDTPGLPDLLVKGSFSKRFQCVEEKFNKDGDVVAELQVEQPRLAVTVLDPAAGLYVDLKGEVTPKVGATPKLADFSVGDLLRHYGSSLIEVLRHQCPALHDPSRDEGIQPASFTRQLFPAQRHTVAAIVKLLKGEDRAALLVGETGCGKTGCSIAAVTAMGYRRPLVMAPPHLVTKSWPDQVRACLGAKARVVVLDSLEAVDRHARDQDPGVVFAILSRETAKLGHAWEGADPGWRTGLPLAAGSKAGARGKKLKPVNRCPRCGSPVPVDADKEPLTPEVLARRRVRCEVELRVPKLPEHPAASTDEERREGSMARWAERLGALLGPCAPWDALVREVAPRVTRWQMSRLLKKKQSRPWTAERGRAAFLSLAAELRRAWQRGAEVAPVDARLYLLALHAAADPRAVLWETRRLYWASRTNVEDSYGREEGLRGLARELLLLLPRAEQDLAAVELRGRIELKGRYGWDWDDWNRARVDGGARWIGGFYVETRGTSVTVDKAASGSFEAARAVLALVVSSAAWTSLPPCGEPLFQAVPRPRRYPLANYIRERYPRCFDALILDECHELSTSVTSAQGLASQQLLNLRLPTIALTGSVMNGYASSLFTLLWGLSSGFRAEYARADLVRFVRDCGYVKRLVEVSVSGATKEVNFGAQTDLRDGGKIVGQAPGVLPALLLRHLLPIAVPLQLEDLEQALPPKTEITAEIEPSPELLQRYRKMEAQLRDQIKQDRFVKGLAGRLFGALTEMVSAPDRLSHDTGNEGASRPNAWETRYPPGCSAAGGLVASAAAFPVDHLLPKERWLIRTLWAERAEGRRVMVFGWHRSVLDRLARLIADLTEEAVVVLDPGKVAPKVREAWIDREVVAKGVPFLVVNPVCVQTGLNCLTWFHSVVWYENPNFSPTIRRQANGRIRRIGQEKEARFFTPTVLDTMQPLAMELLMVKQGVSEATEGLDAEASFTASGVGDPSSVIAGREIGQVLFEKMQERDAAKMS